MTNFWLQFAIQEAVGLVSAFIASTPTITPAQKAAAEQLLADGAAFLSTL
jgi:hypothetical protein